MAAHEPLGAGLHLVHGFEHGCLAVAVEEFRQAVGAEVERRNLRDDVTLSLGRDAHIVQDYVEHVLIELACLHDTHRRQTQAFLVDLRGARGKASRHPSPNVRPVTAIRQKRRKLALVEERPHHLDVHQVGAAKVRIVDDEDVALRKVLYPLYHRAHGELHDADKVWQAPRALHDYLAVAHMVDAAGAVETVGDDRRERHPLQGGVHLVGDLFQSAANDGQCDGVQSHVTSPRSSSCRPQPR